jgi:hypothetical protein
MALGFIGNADFFIKFYEKCIELGLETEQDKTDLLLTMSKNDGHISVFKTKRSKEQIAQDLAKNYGNVLYIKPEEQDQ